MKITHIIQMIQKIIAYPKVKNHKIDTENINRENIIKIRSEMEIPFGKRNFRVPILIFILKTIPYEFPKIFLEIVSGASGNYENKIINSDTYILNHLNVIFKR